MFAFPHHFASIIENSSQELLFFDRIKCHNFFNVPQKLLSPETEVPLMFQKRTFSSIISYNQGQMQKTTNGTFT